MPGCLIPPACPQQTCPAFLDIIDKVQCNPSLADNTCCLLACGIFPRLLPRAFRFSTHSAKSPQRCRSTANPSLQDKLMYIYLHIILENNADLSIRSIRNHVGIDLRHQSCRRGEPKQDKEESQRSLKRQPQRYSRNRLARRFLALRLLPSVRLSHFRERPRLFF
jgi:hypothetical protein